MDYMKWLPLSMQLITKPSGLWEAIIFAFESWIPSYAWAIIVFTLLLKLVLSPMDYFNKSFARKNARMQKVLQPELDALQQKYGDNREAINQKTMELYKKHDYNVVGSCLIMLVNLVLTFVIFITLFNGLNSIARFKIEEQYLELKSAYEVTYQINNSEEEANAAVKARYEEISDKYSWLWIKNVWQSDSPFNNSILTFDQFNNVVKWDENLEAERVVYDKVMNPLRAEVGGPNGYLVLVVAAGALSYFAQKFAQVKFKRKENGKWTLTNEKLDVPQNGKIMLIMLPLLMAYITYTFNAVFSLYVIASSLFGVLTTPLINNLVDRIEAKKLDKKALEHKPTYSR